MKDKLISLITSYLNEKNITDIAVDIEKPKIAENGDFSSNIALKLTKKLGKNPMEIASNIVSFFNEDLLKETAITKIEIKNPGFINFFVSKDYLIENINEILKEKEKYGSSNIGKGKKYNIEFVSANPTGILHLGNARGGAYGDSLARILKFSGYDVTKEYYVNDAGNQINNLALSIQARYLEKCGLPNEMPDGGYFGNEIIY